MLDRGGVVKSVGTVLDRGGVVKSVSTVLDRGGVVKMVCRYNAQKMSQ